MQSFYPHENENVFTHNNWTLSNDFIAIVKSNFFYTEHVRWNMQRFRPSDILEDEINPHNGQVNSTEPVSASSNSTKTKENSHFQEVASRQSITHNDQKEDEHDEGEEDGHSEQNEENEKKNLVNSIRERPKRKVQVPDSLYEPEVLRQTARRVKRR